MSQLPELIVPHLSCCLVYRAPRLPLCRLRPVSPHRVSPSHAVSAVSPVPSSGISPAHTTLRRPVSPPSPAHPACSQSVCQPPASLRARRGRTVRQRDQREPRRSLPLGCRCRVTRCAVLAATPAPAPAPAPRPHRQAAPTCRAEPSRAEPTLGRRRARPSAIRGWRPGSGCRPGRLRCRRLKLELAPSAAPHAAHRKYLCSLGAA